jgi:aminopeptidase N
MDVFLAPTFDFAMENWGLITGSEDLGSPEFASRLVLAHEVAHQWFGNVVTMTWWNEYVFLNIFAEKN